MDRRDGFHNKKEAFEAFDDIPTNPHLERTIGDVIMARYGRRGVLKGMLGVAAISATVSPLALAARPSAAAAAGRYVWDEIAHGVDETHHVATGYDADVLMRWGDPVVPGAPAFDPQNQTAAAQAQQFGYNNDYVGFLPLDGSTRGLLCVNHEYTSPEVMFPGVGAEPDADNFRAMTREFVDVEMAAHGGSVVEIARGPDGKWASVADSRYNRRITAETPMTIDGPAAGHERLRTSADPEGTRVLGTINNCAGGMTAWGTYLMAEENFHGYFWTDQLDAEGNPIETLGGAQAASYKRYGVPEPVYNWGVYHDRFNVDREPNEPNRFGWIVEVDPLDPQSTPVKHTALGRFRHEGAESIVNADGRIVVYSGDDNRFDYVYRFVSAGRYDPNDRAANLRLLSEGTLSVARFDEDGTLTWLPLVWGQGPLTPENGFANQAEVLIDARIAADRLGATPMDRPEDVEPNPVNGKVYVMLTNNSNRKAEQIDTANPRATNDFGHILELTPEGGDHTADRFAWDILVRCGNPAVDAVGALYNPATSANGWFASPDNCAIDSSGRLWVATDQGTSWSKSGTADGIWGLETEGELRGTGKMFYRVPIGAEMCGPLFTPDEQTMFVAVQHPATDGTKNYEPFKRLSTFEDPATRWPDFEDGMPPRPAVVAITRQGGGTIGT